MVLRRCPSAWLIRQVGSDRPGDGVDRAISLALLVVSLMPGVALGDRSATSQQVTAAAEYRQILARYRAGDHQGAVSTIASWQSEIVQRVTRDAKPWPIKEVMSAALLHTEAAIASPSGQPPWHLQIADRLIAQLDAMSVEREFRREWYLVVAAYLHGLGRLTQSEAILARARAHFGDDPEILLAIGSLHETAAGQRVDRRSSVTLSRQLPAWAAPGRASTVARESYRRVIALQPRLYEARLRLGRLLHQAKRVDEAVALLEPVRREAEDGYLAYLAAMFLGAVYEDIDRRSEAELSYRAAIQLYPESQAAYLALSHLAHRSGDLQKAAELIQQMLSRSPDQAEAQDPWWIYESGQLWRLEARLTALRSLVRE